jgi:GNAT superfamily N-acetyltransferase
MFHAAQHSRYNLDTFHYSSARAKACKFKHDGQFHSHRACLAGINPGSTPVVGGRRRGCAIAIRSLATAFGRGKSRSAGPLRRAAKPPDCRRRAELAPELLAALLAWIDEHDVQLTQAVMDPADEKTPQWLAEAGFSELAELLYLVAPGDSLPQHAPSTPFQWLPAATLPQHEMTALVESTYVDTLDCPALNACRATEDVLDGYRATGSSGDRLWLIARHAGRDVGCLLLADHPQFHQFELVYMGLVPPYRGKGLGRAVVQMAKWIAQQLGRQQMVLAVDAKNEPARKVYQAEHFVPWQRRRVMVRYGVARSSKTGIHDA